MPHFRATDRPMWWAVGTPPEGIVASGMTEAGGLTVTGLTMYNAEDENDFLLSVVDGAGDYNPLPAFGEWVSSEFGQNIYGYEGGMVICRTSHYRTEHDPADIPALFTVYREDAGEALDWIAGERVEIGTWRLFDEVLYQCLQAHQTQEDWTPPQVLGTLWAAVPLTEDWAIGVAYAVNDEVTHEGTLYVCLQAHTSIESWSPTSPGILGVLWALA